MPGDVLGTPWLKGLNARGGFLFVQLISINKSLNMESQASLEFAHWPPPLHDVQCTHTHAHELC